jgi:hypothetical protein
LGGGELSDVSQHNAALYKLRDHIYRLVDLESGRELVRLEDPDQNTRSPVFSPDGAELIAWGPAGFRVWDLRMIRAELAKLGLDWDAKPYSSKVERPSMRAPLSVQFVGLEALTDQEFERLSTQAKQQPDSMIVRFNLANWYPRHGQWDKGREVLEDLLAKHPDDHWVHFQLAVLQLYLGDDDAYRRTAESMLARFEQGTQAPIDVGVEWRSPAAIRDRTAKVSLLLPPSESDQVERLRALTLEVVGNEKADEPANSWFAIARGLAEYRSGHFDGAKRQLQVVAADDGDTAQRGIAAQLILAMVDQRAGRLDLAKNRLREMRQRLQMHERQFVQESDRGTGWADWLICEILRREAESLLDGSGRKPEE